MAASEENGKDAAKLLKEKIDAKADAIKHLDHQQLTTYCAHLAVYIEQQQYQLNELLTNMEHLQAAHLSILQELNKMREVSTIGKTGKPQLN